MKIINLHNYRSAPLPPGTIYVGRKVRGNPRPGSPLGNPFRPKFAQPIEECIALYQAWLIEKIEERDRAILNALSEIKDDSVLACWCCTLEHDAVMNGPLVCHAQIVAYPGRVIEVPMQYKDR